MFQGLGFGNDVSGFVLVERVAPLHRWFRSLDARSRKTNRTPWRTRSLTLPESAVKEFRLRC